MKKKQLTSLLTLLFLSLNMYGQCLFGDNLSNQPTKVKWINGDIYLAATNSPSATSTDTKATFSRFDSQGHLLWSIQLDSSSVITDFVATEDNAILLVGRTPIVSLGAGLFEDNRSLIAKIDFNGNLIFCRTVNNNGRETFTSVVRHPSPGAGNSPYYILGLQNEVGALDTKDVVILYNVNNMGVVSKKYQYAFNFDYDNEYGRKLILLGNGNMIMAGSGDGNNGLGHYVEVNRNGGVVNGKIQTNFFASFSDGISLPNNEKILAGRLLGATGGIARYNAQNAVRWGLKFPNQLDVLAIKQDNNSHIYVLGIQLINMIETPVITRITDNGSSATVDWTKRFDDGPLYNTSRIAATFDVSGTGDVIYVDGRASSQNLSTLEDLLIEITDQQLISCLAKSLEISSQTMNPTLEDFPAELFVPSIPASASYGIGSSWTPQENCVCENCEAQFTVTPSSGACFQYNFTSTSTGVINGYLWSFGDGFSQSNAQNPTYTYPGPGTYVVCLYITNGECESTVCQTLVVPDLDYCPTFSQVPFNAAGPGIDYCFGLNFPNPPPAIASFSISIDGANVVGPTSSPILGFCHSFPAAGTYTLCYTATTTDGCTFNCCQEVDVIDPTATFDCLHGDTRSNVPTKVKWINGDIYVAATNSASSGNVATRATFSRYDSQGNWAWSMELDSFSVITDFELTDDNAILLVGRTPIVSTGGGFFVDNRSLIAKVDFNGNLLFCRTINNAGRESFTSIVRHPNPGSSNSAYYILGFENDDPMVFDTYDRVMLFNVNNLGVVNWKRQYRNGFDDEYARKIIIRGNGNMLLVGSGDTSGPDGYLVEVDVNGTIISDRAQTTYFASIADGLALPQNELILAGRLKAPSAGIARYDAQNNVRWGLEFPNQIDLLAVDRDNNGHIFTLGIQNIGGLQTPVITRITDNGSSATVDWMRHLNDGTLSNTARVAATFDVLTSGNIVYAEGRRGNQYGLGLEDLLLAVTGPDFGTCFLDSIVPPVFDTMTPMLSDFASVLLSPAAPATNTYCLAPAWTPQDNCICENCQALFTSVSSTTTCFQQVFANASSGHNLNYYWDFGDGNTSTAENPVHTYAGIGSYTVCLSVSNGTCEDTYCQVVQIALEFECPSIQAEYQSTAANGSIKYEFTLTYSNPSAISSNWITVDGVIVFPATSGPIMQFTNLFPSAGTYRVCYQAITSIGCAVECCQDITIRDPNNIFDCLHGDDRSNVPTKVKWINGDIYVATANSALSGDLNTYASFSRYDDSGNWIWSVELDSFSFITDFEATNDNAILLIGRTPIVPENAGFTENRSLLARIDLNGNLDFCRTINNTGRETFSSIVRHPNPGALNSDYYILGYENENGVFGTTDRVMLFNVSNMGVINWKRAYSVDFDDEYARKLILLDNGNLVMAGSGNSINTGGYFVIVNTSGIVVGGKGQNSHFESIADGFSLPNNELVLGGRMNGPTAGLAKYDGLGAVRWGLRLGAQMDLLAIDHDNNGNIYALGIQTIAGIQTPVITRITDNGLSATVVWQRHFNDGTMTNTNRVAAAFDVMDTGNIVYAEGRDGNQYGFMQEDLLLAVTGPDLGTCFLQSIVPPFFNNISPALFNFVTDTVADVTPDLIDYSLAPAWTPQDSCVCECQALFTWGQSETDCFEYSFANTSSGHNLSYLWNFGDGSTSTTENPTHIFPGQGTYNVCLTITNATCESTYCQLIQIFVPNASIQCVDDVVFNTFPGFCDLVLELPDPTVTAAPCLETSVSCTRSDGQPLSSPYLPGVTTITCTVTDQFNQTASCSYSITIIDAEPPAISCPENICLFIPTGQTSAVVSFPAPTATDNCSVSTSCTPSSGSTFPLGQTTVICTAMDEAGNTADCSFIVEVKTDTSSLCCLNEETFNQQVAAGFSLQRNECQVQLQSIALNTCQQLVIEWGDGTQLGPVAGSTIASHTYSGSGDYTICATVSELGAEGFPCFSRDTCWAVCIVCDTCEATVWDKEFPAPGWDIFSDLTMSPNGEIYVIGTISSTAMDIDGTTLSSVDSKGDVVLAKMNPNGTVSGGHVYRFGGDGGIGDRGETIKLASNGDIVIGGRVTGSNIDFAINGIALNASVAQSTISVTQEHNFIARYNANFELLWFDTIRGDKIMDIAFYKGDEMVAVGSRFLDFAPSLRQNYIAKYEPSGLNNWTKTWDQTFGADGYNDNTWSVETDDIGGIYVCGEFTGEVSLGSYSLGYANNIISGYIANLDANGNFNWAFDIPKLYAPAINQGGVAFAIDIEYPYLFVIGNGSNTLDPTGSTMPTFADVTGGIYVAKYNVATNPTLLSSNLEWAFSIPRVGNDFNDIKLDGLGNLIITGQLINTSIDLDPNPAVNANALFDAAGGDQDFFIAKYTDLFNGNTLPTFVCGIQVSSQKPDVSYGLGIYDGHVFVAGALNHDPFPNFIEANPFIGRYDCPCTVEPLSCCEDVSISEHVLPTDSTTCCYGFDMQNSTGFDMYKMEVTLLESNDWEIDAGNVALAGGFLLTGSSTSQLSIESTTGILPKGTSTDFLSLCLKKLNPLAPIPQTLIFEWYERLPGADTRIACTDTIQINCDITVGTHAVLQNDFRLYPNPTVGNITLEFEQPLQKDHRVRLLGIMGQQLTVNQLPEGQARYSLAFDALPPGMYVLEVRDPQGRVAYKKLVINN